MDTIFKRLAKLLGGYADKGQEVAENTLGEEQTNQLDDAAMNMAMGTLGPEDKLSNIGKGGMFRLGGEAIPARELQQPNILDRANTGANLQKNSLLKELAGTSIGQGESVREGDATSALEAASRALRYQRRLPKPKLPD